MTDDSSRSMMTPAVAKRLTFALYLNAILLAGIGIILLSRGSGIPEFLPGAFAQRQGAIAGGAGVFIMPGQFSSTSFGCYLLDVDSQTIAAYQFFPGEKELRLSAVRTYQWDRRLNSYNTSRPSPLEVRELLKKEADAGRMASPTTSEIQTPQNPAP